MSKIMCAIVGHTFVNRWGRVFCLHCGKQMR